MEIDLFAGLVKPKIALSALPTLENQELPEGALPDFTALFDGAPPEAPMASEASLELEMPAQISSLLPQMVAPEVTPEQSAENTDVEPEEAEKDPLPSDNTAIPLLPGAPLVPQSEPALLSETILPAQSVVAPIPSKIPAPSAIIPSVVFKPEPVPVPVKDPEPRVTSDMWVKRETVETPPSPIAPKTPVGPIFAAQSSPLAAGKFSIMPEKTPVEPKIEAPLKLAKTTPKGAVQMPPQPAPLLGFTNIEAVTEDPAEVQFGIKIERQAAETIPVSRPAQQAAPVATQISAQLPHLLNKAEKQTVELRLDPPELGRVTIHLTTNDTQVTAQIVADRVDTIDLMRRHAELLTATLARAGFSEANLSFQQGQRQGKEGSFEQFQEFTGLVESDTTTAPAPTLAGQDGRLDIRL